MDEYPVWYILTFKIVTPRQSDNCKVLQHYYFNFFFLITATDGEHFFTPKSSTNDPSVSSAHLSNWILLPYQF